MYSWAQSWKKKSTTAQRWLEKCPKQELKQKKEGAVAMAAEVWSEIVKCLFCFFSYAFLFFLVLTIIRQVVSQICHGDSLSLLQCQSPSPRHFFYCAFDLCGFLLCISHSPNYFQLLHLHAQVGEKKIRCAWVQLCFASTVGENIHCCWKRSRKAKHQFGQFLDI